jgi:Cu+-exporting ATPase
LKNALVVERMAGVDTIVLDKTGTLTCSDARGVEFQKAACGVRNAELSADEMNWLGSLARYSTHPNSVRIAKSFSFAPLPVNGFKETPGGGILGNVAGHQILLGSRAWLEKCGINISEKVADAASVAVAIDGNFFGAFTFENSLRPEVAQLLAQLGGRFELALLSGDNEREAARFQKLFGENAILKFNQSPADKLNFIRELQARGRMVMMVGDGLNDAGALKQADVGVAVVEQIGIFSPASDVILDAAELPRLARVLAFSRNAASVVRAGFFISALYNFCGVSIAAAGFLSPIVCAILMPLSSATVVAFSCLTTAWLGRKLRIEKLHAASLPRTNRQLSAFTFQPVSKEAA